jgi:hypothetical protein
MNHEDIAVGHVLSSGFFLRVASCSFVRAVVKQAFDDPANE